MTIEMAEDLKETKWLTCVKQLLRVTKVRAVLSVNQSILAQQSMRLSTYVMYECTTLTQIATSVLLTDEPLVVRGVAKNICEQQITSLAQLCLGSYIPRTRSS